MQIIDEETYLATHGASRFDYGDAALHKNIPYGRIRDRMLNHQLTKDHDLSARRETLRKEYTQKVTRGEIRGPTRMERLIATASGMDENTAVQAARRLLEKMKRKERNDEKEAK
jgi:hypothetical protein